MVQPADLVATRCLEAVASVLYIGNSYFAFNNGVGWHVSRLHASTNPKRKLQSTSVTITGSGLSWHDVDSYFRPGAISAYSFDARNAIVFNKREKLFDVALMMDCSQCPIHPALQSTFHEFARKHSDTVRKHGANPTFFMSWAYGNRPEMTAQLAGAYAAAGRENDALIVPGSLAFASSISKHPEVPLCIEDNAHPSLQGTYLAAATVFAALFGCSPIGLAYWGGLDKVTETVLQTVAWETVCDYYGWSLTPSGGESR